MPREPVETLEHRLVLSVVSFAPMQNYPAGPGPGAVAVADFNRDGRPDLAVAGQSTISDSIEDVVRVLLGNGDGTFRPLNVEHLAGPNISALAVGDFNRDGRVDLAAANDMNPAGVRILLGDGLGGLRSFGRVYAGAHPQGLATADFNRDGFLDLVAADAAPWGGEFTDEAPSPGAAVMFGKGDGTFLTAQKIFTDSVLHHLAVNDFNNDGRADVLLVGPPQAEPAVLPGNTVAQIAFGNGAGEFRLGNPQEMRGVAAGVAAGDLNHDRRADAALALDVGSNGRDIESAVAVLFNRSGDLGEPTRLPSGTPAVRDITIADYDANSHLDIAVAGFNPFVLAPFDVGSVSVLQNRNGTFADPAVFSFVGHPLQMTGRVSFNRDRLPDIALSIQRGLGTDGGSVGVLLNTTRTLAGHGLIVRAHAREAFRARVAGFTITGGPAAPEAFKARINWGDGTASEGVVVAVPSPTASVRGGTEFFVVGDHTYARSGAYRLTIDIVWPDADASLRVFAKARVD